MTNRKKKWKWKSKGKKRKKITYIIYINYYLWYEECFQLTAKGSGTCCILNFKTKRVKKFRTLETDGELSYISPAFLKGAWHRDGKWHESRYIIALVVVFPIDLSRCNTPEYPVVTYKFVGSISRKRIKCYGYVYWV